MKAIAAEQTYNGFRRDVGDSVRLMRMATYQHKVRIHANGENCQKNSPSIAGIVSAKNSAVAESPRMLIMLSNGLAHWRQWLAHFVRGQNNNTARSVTENVRRISRRPVQRFARAHYHLSDGPYDGSRAIRPASRTRWSIRCPQSKQILELRLRQCPLQCIDLPTDRLRKALVC